MLQWDEVYMDGDLGRGREAVGELGHIARTLQLLWQPADVLLGPQ